MSVFNKVINKLNDTFQRSLSINDSSEEEMYNSIEVPKPNSMAKRADIMENLVGAINKIQDVFNTLKVPNTIELPQIVMLGSQSTGKSSVLESIVHRPFLPRGSGIVTRCPLVLQLVECKMNNTKYRKDENGTTKIEEWGEFSHLEGQIFSDFDIIRHEIEFRTDQLAGDNKGICDDPINLKIFSPHVVTLTLVDLPGITKIAVGNQPQNIEHQIKLLIMKYISNPNSIILSVSAANADIATSESLKYAKLVDPNGDRTLAILTKVDLMDKGTDAIDMLTGQVIPVKLGIIGIVNRSQQDINDNKTIEEQLMDEKAYFVENYTNIANRNGIPFLSKRLSELLKHHIYKCLPELKVKIDCKLDENIKIYDVCGEEVKNYGKIISIIITGLTQKFADIIDGKKMMKIKDVKSLIGGPEFCRIFDESFVCALTAIEPELSRIKIKEYMKLNRGSRPPIFPPENLFKDLVNLQIERLRNPSLKCVENAFDEMGKVVAKTIKEQHELSRFPRLEVKIRSIMKNMLNEQMPITKNAVKELINTELSSINTNHPDFSIQEALAPKVEEDDNPNHQQYKFSQEIFKIEKTDKDAEIIQNLVNNYFPIVKKTVQDQVPKIVMYKIINYMKDNVQTELMTQLSQENYAELLMESEGNAQRRENANTMIQALEIAKETIGEIEMGY
ncbi:unnamed protein product [Chironomus riparius]|uniref:Dynamin-1-like protein n=1 Tax=Chironomus riparius TaxID=315576 RepID=A0A9N9WUK8_9DIPT|nr:unnamed protein product [Chironomus riparius]